MKKFFAGLLFLILSWPLLAEYVTYDWPTSAGEALLSDKYRVFVAEGSGPEKELEVLMSNAKYEGDYRASELKGRTFSFAWISYTPATGQELKFRVQKTFGSPSSEAVISPKSYGITPTLLTGGREVRFSNNAAARYISINFKGQDNETPNTKWISHMLCIFIDPKESDTPSPTGTGVAVYSPTATAASLKNASIIYFKKGYHNLKNFAAGDIIDSDGCLHLQNKQAVYFAGGAFIDGYIESTGDDHRLYGRGILSGRLYKWHNLYPEGSAEFNHYNMRGIVELKGSDRARIQGIMFSEPFDHGIVSGNNTLIENVKQLGWHCNNDGIRSGSGTEIRNCFLRAVDDHFYNFNNYVHDVVLWAGHNGSIMTYGWGNYNSGSSLMENVDIINPEWTGLGNNNGLIMSQVHYDFKPYGYGGDLLTVIRNIRIEGSIPGLTNLKPRSGSPLLSSSSNIGYVGDLLLENISVENQFEKGILKGANNVLNGGGGTFYLKNVTIRNVSVGGYCISDSNKYDYFQYDPATSQNVLFEGCTSPGQPPEIQFTNLNTGQELSGTYRIRTNAYDPDYGTSHGSGLTRITYQIFSTADLSSWLKMDLISETPFYWDLNTTQFPDGEYQIRAGAVSMDGESKWAVRNVQIKNSAKGDVNGDGVINIVDALMTAQYGVGLTPPGFLNAASDVNCDGAVTIVDALMIAQFTVGLISHFGC